MTQPQVNQKMNWKAGIIGSLAGGLVFGVMMAAMGMLPVVAGLIGSHSGTVGFVIHMIISLIFGVAFTVFVRFLPLNSIVSGVLYGIILWVLFPFILMPVMMGMKAMAFHISPGNLMSLLGHMMYGIITGIVYNMLTKSPAIQTKAAAGK